MCTDRDYLCTDPLEGRVYKLHKKVLCVACCTEVSQEIRELYFQRKRDEYSSVYPNCGKAICMAFMRGHSVGNHEGWVCKIPKKKTSLNSKKRKREKHEASEKKRIAKKRKTN